jgi:hypothetical protein
MVITDESTKFAADLQPGGGSLARGFDGHA